ncbi:MAG: hypothetical protein ING19_17285 [Azospirillum sp.]|nr:hypothetical protein [Azospirillum sp.]
MASSKIEPVRGMNCLFGDDDRFSDSDPHGVIDGKMICGGHFSSWIQWNKLNVFSLVMKDARRPSQPNFPGSKLDLAYFMLFSYQFRIRFGGEPFDAFWGIPGGIVATFGRLSGAAAWKDTHECTAGKYLPGGGRDEKVGGEKLRRRVRSRGFASKPVSSPACAI